MNELLKVKDIQARLGIGRSAVYALIHEPSFPAPIAINSRTLRWEVTEFQQWLHSRKSSFKPGVKARLLKTFVNKMNEFSLYIDFTARRFRKPQEKKVALRN